MEKTEFISKNPSDTWNIGENIGRVAKRGELYLLEGELGAGKTQFIKGMAKGIGVDDWQYVVSPSFTLINIYEGKEMTLCHVDLYRIDEDKQIELEVEEFLDTGIIAVEWPKKMIWQEDAIKVIIQVIDEHTRKIEVIRP
ncbi:MAG TPA: tRNA (adenosine(37)-N6)-threonylcarbamoyltransferase complex ATPase subunit type 1 TsaE [Syntrophorhabdaceae bacterium]|nr:tRNA (adenosine(37)-N6)-threonylcarbamoyltransferase complex ATPase subunit type 1 TsaE [Syntrophorhabdaceae bacterium]HPU29544.1 tRNA (adenosine(37)-N6)-threonylcarbamoyltransferase complex ATPase subunit type 1 TsaE [Syntrophorhabdaceae bacterium]